MSPLNLLIGVAVIAILAIAIGAGIQLTAEKYQVTKKLARKRKSASPLNDITNVIFN
ncbi:hypothetical protein LP417_35215 (plasmid) [Polaromonas sp. P1-6]|nr:hypothetical protein LP417_35215 [Polaromonas sp. P1-6]